MSLGGPGARSGLAREVGAPLLALLVSLLLGAVIIGLQGVNPLAAYGTLLSGALGSVNRLTETLVIANPLVLTALAFALAFRAGLFNIGAEGQLQMGAIAAAVVGLFPLSSAPWVMIPFSVAVAFASGALWGAVAGVLKTRLKVHEIVSTIMLNFVAINFVKYLAEDLLQEPTGSFPQTEDIAEAMMFPSLLPPTRLHLGMVFTLLCVAAAYLLIRRSTLGYAMRMVGGNPEAARSGGIRVERTVLWAMLLSGGIGGLAGLGEIAGLHHNLQHGFSPHYGFTGIAVALLARSHPVAIVFSAFLFGAFEQGAGALERSHHVPAPLVTILMGTIILFILAADLWRERGAGKTARMLAFLRPRPLKNRPTAARPKGSA
ncbi:MAG: ABC transporter permease [Nitrospinota bacterium]